MTRLLDHHIEHSQHVPYASGERYFLGLASPIDVVEVPDHRIVSGGDQCRHVKGSFRTWPVPPHPLRLSPRIPLPRFAVLEETAR